MDKRNKDDGNDELETNNEVETLDCITHIEEIDTTTNSTCKLDEYHRCKTGYHLLCVEMKNIREVNIER